MKEKKEKQNEKKELIKQEEKEKLIKEDKSNVSNKKTNKIILKIKDFITIFFKKTRNIKFNLLEVILIMFMLFALGIIIGKLFFNKSTITNSYDTEISKVYNELLKNYKDKIDPKGLSDGAIEGMMNFLGDEYSIYFNEEETNDFYEELDGTFIGLGIEITLGEDKIPYIKRVIDDTPAALAQLKEGDKFLKVDGVDVTTNSLEELSNRIKGTTPKTVTLLLERDGNQIEKKITTKEVEINSVESEMYERNNKKIGYIYLSIFASNTDEQFKKALDDLEKQNIDSLIIDVRGNLGGHLDTAKNILDLFLDKSQVLYQLKDKDVITKTYGSTNEVKKYNIAVLVDSASASASEVLASAFKEAYGADIVGNKTYGKGTVQTTLMLSSGSMVKYTIEEWLTSQGNSIDKQGVTPTLEVSLNNEYFKDYDKTKDNQLQSAIELLSNK